ncbi:MAG: cytochrome [Caulobacteraceae bacterium]|nr:cytochrome [Caulobacteraceae bacterium]
MSSSPNAARTGASPSALALTICLGRHLAKMEMRILFEELMPRLESLEFAGQPSRSEAAFVSGPKQLPIRYQMA